MTSNHKTIIAIDGPAGAGKSTIAFRLAERLQVPYLDTGAMYRAVALLAIREGFGKPLSDNDGARVAGLVAGNRIQVDAVEGSLIVLVDGEDVSSQIRTPECSQMASVVSALPAVRRAMVALQQQLGRRVGGVMEGRDIGSVVFPDADLKIFLTASENERAQRRHADLAGQNLDISFAEVLRQQQERDRRDTSRAESPLVVATGAVVVDTTGMHPDEVVERLLSELASSRQQALDSEGQNTVRSRNHRG